MQKRIIIIITLVVFISSGFLITKSTIIGGGELSVGKDYEIRFTSPDPSGVFTDLSGDIYFDPNDLEKSKFEMKVKSETINTGNGMQNEHAKSSMWLDVEQFPYITFTSSKVEKSDNGYKITGNLSLHGITKEISFPFTFQNHVFEGSFMVNRFDYGLDISEGPAGKAAKELKIDLKIPVTH